MFLCEKKEVMVFMKYGYARVSTNSQSLKEQLDKLNNEGCQLIYSEKITGTIKKDRPQFEKLLKVLKRGDILVVTKVDRFARNTHKALEIIEDLFKRGVKVHILNMGLIEDTPTGNLIFSIFSAFSQFERDMIVERTQEGKAYAKANNPNYREGRPVRITKDQRDHMIHLIKEGNSYKAVANKTGVSKSTVYREMVKRGLTKNK